MSASPTAAGTRSPSATVAAFSHIVAVSSFAIERAHDGRAPARLHRHHARTTRVDPTHRLHFFEGLPHADQAGAAAGRIHDDVGERPSELLGQLVAERLLAFESIRLLQRRQIEATEARRVFDRRAAAVGNEPVDQMNVRAIGAALRGERGRDVGRHVHVGFDSGARRVSRQRARGVPRRGSRQDARTQLECLRHRHRHAARLERSGWIGAFVFDEECVVFEAECRREPRRGDERCPAFGERQLEARVAHRLQFVETPHVARARVRAPSRSMVRRAASRS